MDLTGLLRREKHERAPGQAEESLHHQVNAAHRDWVTAQQYFQCVSEPELVDHAVHAIIAAEQRYKLLLRKLREQSGQLGGQG
ncbi:MAG TPA: DUF2508 family protein [Symbiobacteriaceae bacterium]|nr:DUF2508 family protein [Symbiobacteriaceae bacterium]